LRYRLRRWRAALTERVVDLADGDRPDPVDLEQILIVHRDELSYGENARGLSFR
jgi:hypothetical protein